MSDDVKTKTLKDRDGVKVEVELGVDGKTPVSPTNPPAKAVLKAPADNRAYASSAGDSNTPSADDSRDGQKALEAAQKDSSSPAPAKKAASSSDK